MYRRTCRHLAKATKSFTANSRSCPVTRVRVRARPTVKKSRPFDPCCYSENLISHPPAEISFGTTLCICSSTPALPEQGKLNSRLPRPVQLPFPNLALEAPPQCIPALEACCHKRAASHLSLISSRRRCDQTSTLRVRIDCSMVRKIT